MQSITKELPNAEFLDTQTILDPAFQLGINARNAKCIVSNGKVVNMVSKSYGFISNDDFFGGFENVLEDEHINYSKEITNYEDSRFTVDYVLDGQFQIGEEHKGKYSNDTLQPKIRLTHSFDGLVNTAGYFGFFRKICDNGLHVATTELAFKIKRTIGNTKIIFPAMKKMIEDYKANEMVTLVKTFQVLQERKLNNIEIDLLLKDLSKDVFRYDISDKNEGKSKNILLVEEIIEREALALNQSPNAWLLYNAMNEVIYSNERNKKNDGKRRDLDRLVFQRIENEFCFN